MGDALAISLLEARGFSAEDFAFSHPGGALGRKLLLKIEDIMHSDQEVPFVTQGSSISSALVVMTEKGFGMTTVVDDNNRLLGIFTDGDVRRCVDQNQNFLEQKIENVMTKKPKTVHKDILAAEALGIMEQGKITALVVEDDERHPIGVVHMHDILRAGVA
jgi:arabinose-5-phosphate isomerase